MQRDAVSVRADSMMEAEAAWNALMQPAPQPAPPPEQMTVRDHYICAGIAGRLSDFSLHTAISIGNHAYELSRQK